MSVFSVNINFVAVTSYFIKFFFLGNYPSVHIQLSVAFSIPLCVGNKMLVKDPQGKDYTNYF